MTLTAKPEEIRNLIDGYHTDPFSLLGMHKINFKSKELIVVRAFIPNAKSIFLIDLDNNEVKFPMEKSDERGFFEIAFDDRAEFFSYKYEVTDFSDHSFSVFDPYCFLPTISDFDIHLFNEGNHHKIYEKLGAHLLEINGIEGVSFCVWAPSAKRVSVVGDFNQWDGRRHQMRLIGASGIWEIFIPGLISGDIYKYEIKTPTNEIYIKSDPYAFFSELSPNTASIVYDVDSYTWNDSEWIKERETSNIFEKPISIYEVHLGSWTQIPDETTETGFRFLTYREFTDRLISYVLEMNYNYIELLPITEHPFDGSWGYQVTGYYSVTSRYGSPDDFKYFVDQCHLNNIGVILDWVPAHFPKDAHGLARFDGTAIYEHHDKRQGEQPDWGTHIFNFGRHEVRNFLISNAVFWFEKYHLDGLRVDAVASMLYLDFCKKHGEWVPNKYGGRENLEAIEFIKQLNITVHKYFPGIMMVAEESTSWPFVSKPHYAGGLGFTFKWNMGWMNDFLKYMSLDPIFRKYNHHLITFSLMYAFSENFMLVLSHDEVVHGKCSMLSKMPGDYWQKFANLRAAYGYFYGHPGKKLLFMGSEYGQFIEWKYKESLDWHLLDYELHKKMQDYVKTLNNLYQNDKALHEVDFSYEGFQWIDCNDTDHSVISFMRKAKDWKDMLIFVCNFTPVVHYNYRIGAPCNAFYKEIINSDSEEFGGSNVGNLGGVHSDEIPMHNMPYSLNLTIPPLATVIFRPEFKEDEIVCDCEVTLDCEEKLEISEEVQNMYGLE